MATQAPLMPPFVRVGALLLLLLLLAYLGGLYLRKPTISILRNWTPRMRSAASAAPKNLTPPAPPEFAEFLAPEDRHEAARMLQHLDSHPRLLKAAICLLVQSRRLPMLRGLLDQLHKNFNHRYGYPILLFHEKDFLPLRDSLRRSQASPLFFQTVHFQVPKFFEKRYGSAEVVKICPWSGTLGYRHMCRFHSKTFYEQPVLRGLEYYWRLDDDSVLARPFAGDPFQLLRDSGGEYGYFQTALDSHLCTYNLWNVTRHFITERKLQPTFFNQIPENFMFFNNFEISALRFWWSPEYRSFIDAIDQHGGVFRYRWGDAPIKTLALSIFVNPRQIVKFRDIGYQHGNPQVPPRLRLQILEQRSISANAMAQSVP